MREWTTQELRVLKAYAGLGKTAISVILERSPQSIEWAATMNGISLKISDEDIDTQAVALRLVETLRDTPSLPVCPMCGKRFARMKSGMCRCCHLDQLLTLHQESLDEKIRLRKLDKARQDKRRMRVCERCGQPFFPRPSSTEDLCQDCGGR